jgi:hypothetical protein
MGGYSCIAMKTLLSERREILHGTFTRRGYNPE